MVIISTDYISMLNLWLDFKVTAEAKKKKKKNPWKIWLAEFKLKWLLQIWTHDKHDALNDFCINWMDLRQSTWREVVNINCFFPVWISGICFDSIFQPAFLLLSPALLLFLSCPFSAFGLFDFQIFQQQKMCMALFFFVLFCSSEGLGDNKLSVVCAACCCYMALVSSVLQFGRGLIRFVNVLYNWFYLVMKF